MAESILSYSKIIYSLLAEDEAITAITTNMFPVVTESAELPCVAYALTSLDHDSIKGGSGPIKGNLSVNCYTSQYTQGAELAEAVCAALDNVQASSGGLVMRGCRLVNASETWENDAFVRTLDFEIRI